MRIAIFLHSAQRGFLRCFSQAVFPETVVVTIMTPVALRCLHLFLKRFPSPSFSAPVATIISAARSNCNSSVTRYLLGKHARNTPDRYYSVARRQIDHLETSRTYRELVVVWRSRLKMELLWPNLLNVSRSRARSRFLCALTF